MSNGPSVNLHPMVERSVANGPGERIVLWFQGCPLACPGCFNPETHATTPRRVMPVARLLEQIVERHNSIEGVTITGGEPFEQADALRVLLAEIRRSTALSVLVFTGYTRGEIERRPNWMRVLRYIDVLIAGRYVADRRVAREMLGSSNQRIHRLTDRYTLESLQQVPVAEAQIDAHGRVMLTGVDLPQI